MFAKETMYTLTDLLYYFLVMSSPNAKHSIPKYIATRLERDLLSTTLDVKLGLYICRASRYMELNSIVQFHSAP